MYIDEFCDLMDRNECENNPTSSTMIIIVATKSQAQVPNGNWSALIFLYQCSYIGNFNLFFFKN